MSSTYEHLLTPQLLDSRLKLHMVLQFLAYPQLTISSSGLSERLRESPWEIAEAFEELAACGLLQRIAGDGPAHYRLGVLIEHQELLNMLVEAFNDPFKRDQIYTRVREAQHERRFYAWLATDARAGSMSGLVIS